MASYRWKSSRTSPAAGTAAERDTGRDRRASSLTCDSWLGVALPHLSESLVNAAARRRVRAVARRFSGDGLGVLETRLARGADAVDFAVRLTAPSPPVVATSPLPPHLRDFFAAGWRRLGHPRPVPAVWLEFDLDLDPRRPGPLHSDPLRPGARETPWPIVCARLEGPVAGDWLVGELLPALHGRPLDAAQRTSIRRAVAELPPPGSVLYAFSLRPRHDFAVRLELFGLAPAAMTAYLERLGLAEAGRRVTALEPYVRGSDRFHLSFDVTDRIGSRIGVEYAFARVPGAEPRWVGLLDRLVAADLCTAEKRDAVLAWPGYDSLWTAARRWPAEAVRRGGYCVRCLSHLKLVSRPGHEPEAKAYLIVQHVTRGASADSC